MHYPTRIRNSIPLLLRIGAAGLKFALLIYLGSNSPAVELGNYALLVVIVALSTQLLGLELNAELARKIHRKSAARRADLVSAQFACHVVTYVMTLPGLILLFEYLFRPGGSKLLVFVILVVLEHLAVEIYRLLVTLGKHSVASYYQFLRTAPYIIWLVSANFFLELPLTIYLIALSWAVNVATALVIFVILYRSRVSGWSFRWSRSFQLAKLMVVRARSYFAIICIGALTSYVDKLILSLTLGKEATGIFFYLGSFATIISLWLTSTLGVVEGPRLIKSFYVQGRGDFSSGKKALFLNYVYHGAAVSIVVSLSFWAAAMLGFNPYLREFDVLLVLICSTLLASLTEPLKLSLYLHRNDTALLKIYLYSFLVLVLGVSTLSVVLQLLGAALASLASSAVFFFGLLYFQRRKRR